MRTRQRLMFLVFAFCCSLLSSPAKDLSPLDFWSWSNPQVSGNNLAAIAYGNGRYVAVGNWGTVLVSTNGQDWWDRRLPVSAVISCLTFGNGLFVAAAHEGMLQSHGYATTYILTSPDGENWSPVFSRTSSVLYGRTVTLSCLRFLNDRFVAVGGHAGDVAPREQERWLMSSADGTNWVQCIQSTNTFLLSVSYLNGKYVAVGEISTVLISTDGLTWNEPATNTINQFFPPHWTDIIPFGGRFLVAANTGYLKNPSAVYGSVDGEHWEFVGDITGYGAIRRLVPYGNRLFACGEANKSFVSDDGILWVESPLPVSVSLVGAEAINGQTFLVGANGYILRGTDGAPWQTNLPRLSGFNPMSLVYGNGRFVGFSNFDGVTHTSEDGAHWQLLTNAIPGWVKKARFLNGRFFAVGPGEGILTSTNGLDWLLVHSSATSPANLNDVAWNGNVYVAFGDYSVGFISTNGLDWVDANPGTAYQTVVGGAGVFVASHSGELHRSTDGLNWTLTLSTNNAVFFDSVWGNGRFVFVDPNGRAFVSTNGSDWVNSTLLQGSRVRRVVFTGSQFIAATESAVIFSSPDGLTWRSHLPATPVDYTILEHGNDTILVGGSGMLVQSDPLSSAVRTIRELQPGSNSHVTLDVQAFPSSQLDLQTASELGDWTSIETIYLPTGRARFTQPSNGSVRFFRARPY